MAKNVSKPANAAAAVPSSPPQPTSSNNIKLEVNSAEDGSSDLASTITKRYRHQCPLFTGSFNNWEEPCRMIRVKDFSHFIERRKVQYLTQLKRMGLIQKEPQKYQELSAKDKATYQ